MEVCHLGLETVEQLADLVAHEQLVRELPERREALRPGFGTPAGHHHELVPLEDAGRDPKVDDLRKLAAERCQGASHRPPS